MSLHFVNIGRKVNFWWKHNKFMARKQSSMPHAFMGRWVDIGMIYMHNCAEYQGCIYDWFWAMIVKHFTHKQPFKLPGGKIVKMLNRHIYLICLPHNEIWNIWINYRLCCRWSKMFFIFWPKMFTVTLNNLEDQTERSHKSWQFSGQISVKWWPYWWLPNSWYGV